MKSPLKYVVFFKCKEARSSNNEIVVGEGDLAVVMNEPEGWVEATAIGVSSAREIPGDAKIFTSVYDCDEFMDRWKGHPWYRVPNGSYEITCVVPHMVSIQQGWERIS